MKLHLSLAARDLDASIAFYRTLLDAEPAKAFEDYALFLTADPGLELALDRDSAAAPSSAEHFGIVVERPEAVGAAAERPRAAGFAVEVETQRSCCFAVQNQVWASDPDGRRWETYFVIAEADRRVAAPPRNAADGTSEMSLGRRLVAEFVGTAALLLAIVGPGIMTERLAGGNAGFALLANARATGGALTALSLTFGPISGAHFNPVVTLADAWQSGIAWRDVASPT